MAEARGLAYRPELDGLRAVAVGAVVGHHIGAPTMGGGFIGVDVFFVISGFLITTLLLEELRSTSGVSLRPFYRRRFARLMPALVLVTAAATAASIVRHPDDVGVTLRGAGLTLSYLLAPLLSVADLQPGPMGHAWSLSVEEFFYFVWPLALLRLWRPSAEATMRRVVMVLTVAVAWRAAGLAVGFDSNRFYFGPDMRADQLLIGCSLAALLSAQRWTARSKFEGVLAVVAVLFLGWALTLSGLDPRTTQYSLGAAVPIALASAVLIRHLYLFQGSALSTVARMRPLVWIGQRSYGIYLWHLPIHELVESSGERRAIVQAVTVSATLVVAAASFRWVEAPLRTRWRLRRPSRLVPGEAEVREDDQPVLDVERGRSR